MHKSASYHFLWRAGMFGQHPYAARYVQRFWNLYPIIYVVSRQLQLRDRDYLLDQLQRERHVLSGHVRYDDRDLYLTLLLSASISLLALTHQLAAQTGTAAQRTARFAI